MALRRIRTVLVAGATVASLTAVGIAAGTGAAGGSSTTDWAMVTHVTKSGPTSFTALVKAAKKEGRLNIIADPLNWANYGTIIKGFEKTYGIRIDDYNPDGSSAEEITAITEDTGRSSDPDEIDVGENFAVSAVTSHLLAPYKVQTWSEIPAGL